MFDLDGGSRDKVERVSCLVAFDVVQHESDERFAKVRLQIASLG
jgi:hypothetical protein